MPTTHKKNRRLWPRHRGIHYQSFQNSEVTDWPVKVHHPRRDGRQKRSNRCCNQELKGYEKPAQHENNGLFAIEDDTEQSSSLQNGFIQGNDSGQQQQQLHSRQSVHHGVNQDVEQRAKEIDGIAKSISDLADMFKDLGNLVLDQGTLLDRIDYNVEQMSTDIRGAAQELKTATEYQKRSGKCRIIFLLVLLVFAAVLVLVYKPRHSTPKQVDSVSGSVALDSSSQANTNSPTTSLRSRSDAPTTSTDRERRNCGRWKPC